MSSCDRYEVLAGAITLGEATDDERSEYRAHLSGCARCLSSLSGERELERLSAVVQSARDDETWEPVLPPPWVAARNRRTRILRYSASIAGLALAISLGLHFALAMSVGRFHPTPANPITLQYDGTHVTLERRARNATPATVGGTVVKPAARAAAAPATLAQQPVQSVVVEHNVVTLRAPVVRPQAQPQAPQPSVAVATRRRQPMPPAVEIASTNAGAPTAAQTPQPMENHAESLAVMQPTIVRNAMPLGGESALNPQPPMIAYSQGAEGTTAFEVIIDERGAPTRCTITKSSGYLSLDDAVCTAAMKARYAPKQINGRPVQGVYHDAFTFHTSPQQ